MSFTLVVPALKRWAGRRRPCGTVVYQVIGLSLLLRSWIRTIIAMRALARRRRIWSSIAAGVVALLVLLVIVETHDPRPVLTRATIDVMQWSLQTQSVK